VCGFAGIVTAPELPVDRAGLARMTRTLVHRGPDDEGSFVQGPCGLGHRRLSIIDIEGGHQPMTGAAGQIAIVVNGELYNCVELRRELQDNRQTEGSQWQ
jgi:asparagine synthase (glutamine-hydrolysing)